jgi:hypothetical protein
MPRPRRSAGVVPAVGVGVASADHAEQPRRRGCSLRIGATARRFALYWRAIYPSSALIRRMWLRAIRERAERAAAGGEGRE